MDFLVAFHILSEFLQPEGSICLGRCGIPASLMSMPKASLDEYGCFMPGQDNIRPSRQVTTVQPEPETKPVKHRADDFLGMRVLASDPGHQKTSFIRFEPVYKVSLPT